MNDNPYSTPASLADVPQTPGRRPWALVFSAAFLAFPGIVLGLWMIAVVATHPTPGTYFSNFGPGAKILLGIMVPLSLISSIGVLLRFRWAWFLAQIYCLSIAHDAIRGWLVHGISPEPVKSAFAALYVLIVVYFYFKAPRDYFGIHCRTARFAAPFIVVLTVAAYHAATWIIPLWNHYAGRIQ